VTPILTFGTAAPDWSEIVPVIAPVFAVCAWFAIGVPILTMRSTINCMACMRRGSKFLGLREYLANIQMAVTSAPSRMVQGYEEL
jgi:hypothetical protein